ncbi:hypothetical protein [Gordonia sp. WA4-43]|uniref:hypothetical protein n=1 Tax=Gordonia sp. WA4-43 TaxID=2878678 RepID=UPI001CFBEACE|nr:hypothetical protein [Gordonia sp. WA4-43]UCZ92656.1 hypothetical protein LEL84_19915 [Gordonia sp. WA4-43]
MLFRLPPHAVVPVLGQALDVDRQIASELVEDDLAQFLPLTAPSVLQRYRALLPQLGVPGDLCQ